MPTPVSESAGTIPTTLASPGATRFWLAVCLIGTTTGLAAAMLTRLLEIVQHVAWHGSGTDILAAASQASVARHLTVLLAAAILTGAGQLLLKQLSSGNCIDTTAAIWFYAGRMPALRTLGSAVLSIFAVGMGASMGREGAPKQAGAVFANLFADAEKLSDEQRRLLVACGAGAGMGAAYGVPLGGARFALEVMRGKLALRFVLPALFTSLIATGVSWLALPDAPTYIIPSFPLSASVIVWAIMTAPLFAFGSILYVRLVRWADKGKARGWQRFIAPAIILGLLGAVSVQFPELLGNGKDLSQLLFADQVGIRVVLALLLLKPLATILCMRSGVPGGLFTPSLTFGLCSARRWDMPGVRSGQACLWDFLRCSALVQSCPLRPKGQSPPLS
jgi:H+/Cl- antiporter ClcA